VGRRSPINKQTMLPPSVWLMAQIEALERNGRGPAQMPERIPKGEQHNTLFRLGCAMRANGFGEGEILAAVWEANLARCEEPGPRENIEKLAASICSQYEPGKTRNRPPGSGESPPDTETSHVRSWPAPMRDEAMHGLAGKLVQTLEPHTESDPAALLVQTLAGWGSLIGRGPFYVTDGAHHHTNLYVNLVGTTSKGRKGTSGEMSAPCSTASMNTGRRTVCCPV
jgi:hypothetical protein